MQLALFDLDHTLIPLDSDSEWARFLVRVGVVDPGHAERENERFGREYRAGTLDIQEWLNFQLEPLARLEMARLDELRRQFVAEVIEPVMLPAARELVAKHQNRGDLCAIVTATNEFVTAPIAAAFGIDHLVATRIEQKSGRYTGKPQGIPCFQAGKINNTEDWLNGLGYHWSSFERIWFYSDSANDLPLMHKVSNPVAANPDPRLTQVAVDSGWPIVRLFETR